MARPLMFLVAGVNGAGKSTYTKTLLRKYPETAVIDPDKIAKSMTGSFTNIESKAVEAGKLALKQVKLCIKANQSFIVESTISGRTYLRYLSLAKKAGFKTILVYVCIPSSSVSAQRVKQRVKQGGHHIPIEDIERRFPKSLENLSEHIKLCDLSYISNNTEHYALIASYRKGKLHQRNNIPDFIAPYLPL